MSPSVYPVKKQVDLQDLKCFKQQPSCKKTCDPMRKMSRVKKVVISKVAVKKWL